MKAAILALAAFIPVVSIAASPLLEDMRDARLVVYPGSLKSVAEAAINGRLKLSDTSQNVVSVSANSYRGGVLNGTPIEFGSVSFEVYREGTVAIKGKNVPATVGVWSGSQVIYADNGMFFLSQEQAIRDLANKALR